VRRAGSTTFGVDVGTVPDMAERRPGRPQEFGERITKAVRIDPALNDQLKEQARLRGVSVNLLIDAALRMYLDRLVPVDQLLQVR
jgi:hypothetical protein